MGPAELHIHSGPKMGATPPSSSSIPTDEIEKFRKHCGKTVERIGDGFETAFDLIEDAARGLLEDIRRRHL